MNNCNSFKFSLLECIRKYIWQCEHFIGKASRELQPCITPILSSSPKHRLPPSTTSSSGYPSAVAEEFATTTATANAKLQLLATQKIVIIRQIIEEKKLLRAHFVSGIVMEEPSFFDKMMINLRATCKYYTGYPKDLGPSRVIHFTSEREFVQLLHQGYPVVVAFTIKCNLTKHLDKVLEEAAVEFYPHVKFMRVECPKYPGFCITRQKKEYPFIEMFHSPEQAINQGRVADPNITKYSVQVLPFNYDISAYGFREFFKRHGIRQSSPT